MKYKVGGVYKIRTGLSVYDSDFGVYRCNPNTIILILDCIDCTEAVNRRYKILINDSERYIWQDSMDRIDLEEII